ncbi:MAG: glycosyl hydrolase, partial [Verrucomicrobiales bacterium]
VASQGPLWSGGGERGLYKSVDGGENWELILSDGKYTGVTAVVMDPKNPDTLYAATHQRHRTVWGVIDGGPETGIYKSVDAGANWEELTKGLPGEDMGKIGLAVSLQNPDVVYATIELADRKGGFWRTDDAGASWSKMSDYISGGTGPHYYQEIWVDPHRFDVIYQANVKLGRSEDGGKTWGSAGSQWKHVDNHAVAFHPDDPDFLLVGCDGGLYRSYDRAKTYDYFPNLPLTQFYKVDVDYAEPFYNIVGGTQDNSTQYGPSRTGNGSGIRNSDWRSLIGGDGHDCAIDPKDPNIIYCESQKGYIRRVDLRTGESTGIRPRPEPGEPDLRNNWDSPILISPHSHTRVYFGSKKLHRTDDRGDSWTAISPDLSRGLDRYKLKHMDRVWSIDAMYDSYAMSQYGNITSISESPVKPGLIYVGTDDGLIQVTEDGGKSWRRIERIYGIPEFAFVNDIKADRFNADRVYAVLDNHKFGDFKPYLIRSDDRGRTWKSIAGDIPERHILWRIEQDHEKEDLLFLGTEFGVYTSLDAGTSWLRLAGAPKIPFRDLAIQRRENDLVGATFGRGFYVFDDYAFLRELSKESLEDNELLIFPIRKARQFVRSRALGGEKGSQGDRFYTAKNPDDGAVFTWYLRDSYKTAKQKRKKAEAETKKAGGDNPRPDWQDLKNEQIEQAPSIQFTVKDSRGNVVRRLSQDASPGLHRFSWDLRHAAPGASGVFVVPGTYTVSAAKNVGGELTPLGEPRSFEVVRPNQGTLKQASPAEIVSYYKRAGKLIGSVRAASGRLSEALEQIEEVQSALKRTATRDLALAASARSIELSLLEIKEQLSGNTIPEKYSESTVPSISDRAYYAVSGRGGTYGPTKTNRRDLSIAASEFKNVEKELRVLLEKALPSLFEKLEAAGVPWTKGRPIP